MQHRTISSVGTYKRQARMDSHSVGLLAKSIEGAPILAIRNSWKGRQICENYHNDWFSVFHCLRSHSFLFYSFLTRKDTLDKEAHVLRSDGSGKSAFTSKACIRSDQGSASAWLDCDCFSKTARKVSQEPKQHLRGFQNSLKTQWQLAK